jgi:hypothetical protein
MFLPSSKELTWRLCNSFTYTDKAFLVYRHPDESEMFVQKHIRTYHPYHRENISVIYFANEPLSGLSKDDVERDVGSFTWYVTRSTFCDIYVFIPSNISNIK